MNLYYAYGLIIKSDISLSYKIDTEEKPDIKVKIADLSHENSELINNNGNNSVLGKLPGIATLLIKDGTEIAIDPEPGIDETVLRPCILGSAMAVLLQQRGFLVLHASCVAIDGVAVAFLGHSGDGKSTICSAFHRCGYKVLTDDVMAIRIEQDNIWVIPSIPEIKLRSDSANSIGYHQGILSPLHPLTKKKVHQIKKGFDSNPVFLKQIYLLDKGDKNQIQTLSIQESFIELICHTRGVKTLRSQNLEQGHFKHCVTVAQNISISKLIRKFTLSELPNLVDLVVKNIEDNKLKQDNTQKLLEKTYSNSEV